MGKYSDTLMDHFLSPRNAGHMSEADRIGMVGTPGRTLFMIVYLRLRDGRIADLMYQTNGCGASIAAGSALTELVNGLAIEEGLAITPERLSAALDGIPPDKAHCAVLAITALRAALKQTPSAQQG